MTQREEILTLDHAQDILDELREKLAEPRITEVNSPRKSTSGLLRMAIAIPLVLLLGVQLGLHSDHCQPQLDTQQHD